MSIPATTLAPVPHRQRRPATPVEVRMRRTTAGEWLIVDEQRWDAPARPRPTLWILTTPPRRAQPVVFRPRRRRNAVEQWAWLLLVVVFLLYMGAQIVRALLGGWL